MRPPVAGAVSGVLAALSLPPFHLWPLAFVALVPVALALSRPGLERSEATGAGLAFGAAFYGLLLHWVPFTVAGMVPLGWVLGLAGILVLVGIGGVQGRLLGHLLGGRPRGSLAAVLVLPAVWVSTELLLSWAGPLAAPWTPLGLALAPVPEVAGMAEWVGTHGLGFWIAAVNGVFACALRAERPGRATALLAAGLLAVGLPAVAGSVRARSLPVSEAPSLFVGRMGLSRSVLLDPDRRDGAATRALRRMATSGSEAARSVGADGPALGVLPETPFGSPPDREAEAALSAVAGALGVPLLAGAHVMTDDGLSNAVVLFDAAGARRTVHAKTRLVPGVERPGLVPGRERRVVSVGGARMALAVCFESAFGADFRALRAAGAELIVNPTNDAWYRPRPFGGLSAAHLQHRAHLQLRAIETRMGAVRSPVGGEFLVVSPTGRILQRAAPGGEGFLVARPLRSSVTPLYVRLGDVAGVLAASLLVGLVAARAVRSRRRGSPPRPASAR